MKRKQLNLTALEFFERLINGGQMYGDSEKTGGFFIDSSGKPRQTMGNNLYSVSDLNKPRTVWVEQSWHEDIPDHGFLCKLLMRNHKAVLHIVSCDGEIAECSIGNKYNVANLAPLSDDEYKAFLMGVEQVQYDENNWAENPSVEFPVYCSVSQNGLDPLRKHIVSYDKKALLKFTDSNGTAWQYATPVDE